MEYKFHVNIEGSESKAIWHGDFKYKRPSLGDRARIDVMRARLSGDLETISVEVADFIEAVSHLRYTLVDFPKWWGEANYGYDLYDGNVISEIYNKVLAYEAGFKERLTSGDEKDVEAGKDEPFSIDESLSPTITSGATGPTPEVGTQL